MNPWLILLGLVLVALVYVAVPVGAAALAHYRRPWRLKCPRAGTEAQIKVNALRAAVTEVLGRGGRSIERCSLWPSKQGCREECLELPPEAMRRVRRGEAPPRETTEPGVRTILVPLDGSPGSESVLAAVGELARAHGARVRFLKVMSPVTAVASDERVVAFADQESERVELEARAYFKRLAERLPGVAVAEAVRFGEPAAEIVEEAEAAGADLIAMASHRRTGFSRLVRGSVAARVERATTIPLLLVRYGEPAAA